MATAGLVLRNIKQKLMSSSSSLMGNINGERSCLVGNRQNQKLMNRFMSTSSSSAVGEQEKKNTQVTVSDKKSPRRFFPRRRGRRSLWRNSDDRDYFAPALYGLFPSGLGNALMEATENINRIFNNLDIINPSQLMGQLREEEDCYKLRYEVPGLTKDDLKITVDNGVLMIKGEHKEEEEDEEYWSAKRYGYYNTSLSLPEDAKVEEIKAEIKNGVLTLLIPRLENLKKEVKEIQVQ